jgi:diguanylate cyclase (GGDEF)-like protein
MAGVLVKDIVSSMPVTAGPDTSLGEAAEHMVATSSSCMIVGCDRHLMGIITERDLARVLVASQHELGHLTGKVTSYMSSPVVTVNHNETLYEALVVARTERVRNLPVVDDDDQLVGIVTDRDLANAHFHVIEVQSGIIERAIAKETRELLQANQELQAMSMEDHLLDIGNRRAMEVDLIHTHTVYERFGRPYGVVLIDVDYFKGYNDSYGHQAGDAALKQVAQLIKSELRAHDRLYRFGGEELLVLVPAADAANAGRCAQRLVDGLAARKLANAASPFGKITASAGTAIVNSGCGLQSWKQVVELADRALYKAKTGGRNRAVLADPMDLADGSAKVFKLR